MAAALAVCFSCNQKPAGTTALDTDSLSTDSVQMPIRINCLVEVTPENRDAVVALSKELVDSSRTDAGNVDYDIMESVTEPNKLMIFETWQDQPSLDAHSASPHFTRLVPQIQEKSKMTIQIFTEPSEKDQLIRINCPVDVKAENRDAAIALYKELVAETRKADKGMIDYDLYTSMTDPTKMLVFETWENQEVLDAHSNSPHFKRLVPQIGELASSSLDSYKLQPAE